MEKTSKEYYEKLRTINYSKVEITLYNKLKDYGIWWVKNRVEDTENYYLYFEDKIKYLKKHIREFLEKQIKEYNEKDFNLIYNEKFEKYEAEYKKENIPMIFHYNEYNEELNGIEISYKKETFFIEIPQQDDYSFYNDYLNPSPPFSWEDYFKKNYSYDEDKKILEMGIYCYENIEYLMIITAYILLKMQDSSWEKGFTLDSLELPENIGSSYIKDSKFEFKNHIRDLINKFEKDELLAFILFAFDFNYYLKKKTSSEKNILTSPLPDSLSNLSFKLLNIKDNDYVLNLFSELGNFVIESYFKSPNILIRGVEDFYITRNIAILKASLISNSINFLDVTNDYNKRLEDNHNKELEDIYNRMLEDEDNKKLEDIVWSLYEETPSVELLSALDYTPKQKVDKIFSNLALISDYYNIKNLVSSNYEYEGKNTESQSIQYKRHFLNLKNDKTLEEIIENASLEWLHYIELMTNLKDEGKAISLVESKILYDNENIKIRKYFIENGYIEAIILLPKNMMIGLNDSLVFIIFSKGNKKIRFVDASNFGKIKKFKEKKISILKDNDVDEIINLLNNEINSKTSISKKIEDFSKNYYNLDVNVNIDPSNKDFSKETVTVVKLKDLIKNIMRGSQISPKELEDFKTNEETSNIYLSVSDVNDGLIEFENIENYLKEIPENQEKFLVKNECILLSKYGIPPYKFTVVDILGDKKIIASSNFIIIEVDKEKINPWYLAALFSSSKGTKILKEAYSNSKNGSLSIKKLEEVMIPVHSKKVQEKISYEYFEILSDIEKEKTKLKKLLENKEKIFEKIKVEV